MTDPKPAEQKQDVVLTIRVSAETGKINVEGPIHDPILAFGLLAVAHQAIAEHHKKGIQNVQG